MNALTWFEGYKKHNKLSSNMLFIRHPNCGRYYEGFYIVFCQEIFTDSDSHSDLVYAIIPQDDSFDPDVPPLDIQYISLSVGYQTNWGFNSLNQVFSVQEVQAYAKTTIAFREV